MASSYRSYHFKKQGVRHICILFYRYFENLKTKLFLHVGDYLCQYCPVMELRLTDILFPCLKLGNVVKHLSVKKKNSKSRS